MFCQLGSIVFDGLKTPTSISQSEGAIFAEHALINSKPRLQPTGAKLKEITLSVKLHASFCNVETELQNLRDALTGFTVMPLLWGNGKLEGNFIITDFSIDYEDMDTIGNKISVVLSVPLREVFIKDPIDKKQQQARKNSFATGKKKPPVKSARLNPNSCEQTISNLISAIKGRAKLINTIALSYTNTGIQSNEIHKHLSYMQNNVTRLISIANTAGSCANKIPGVGADANNLLSEVNFFTKADPANIAGIKTENNILQNRVRLLERTATPLIKKAATRRG